MFSSDAAGIDPEIGTRSFGGMFASHRKGAAPLVFSFDSFSVVNERDIIPGSVALRGRDRLQQRPRSRFLTRPHLRSGPTGVSTSRTLLGDIHELDALDSDYQVASDQVITTLGTRLTLGLAHRSPFHTGERVPLGVSFAAPRSTTESRTRAPCPAYSGPDLTQRGRDHGASEGQGQRRDQLDPLRAGRKLYVFGGRIRNADATTVNGTLNTTEMYAPDTDTWVPRAPMPTGRRSIGDREPRWPGAMMGGERRRASETFPDNEEYEPVTDSWRILAPDAYPEARRRRGDD